MDWNQLFGSNTQPSFTEMSTYIGGEGERLWTELFEYMLESYNAKPKMSYSGCSGKPGWNVKFQKSGVSFGTLYPEESGFSVFIVLGYKLDAAMETIRDRLSSRMREMYEKAPDYMKMGRWMMFRIEDRDGLEDYKLLLSAKLAPKK